MSVPADFSHRDFADELKQRVNEYFVRNGLSRHANAAMIVKTVILVGTYVGTYGLILTGLLPLSGQWLACFVMGVAMAGIGFSVAHDALHGAYSASPRVNRLLGYTFDALGANSYMWKITHNIIHHTHTNIHGHDEDVEVSPLIRLSPYAERKFVHRFQHVFAFVAYSLSTLFWVVAKDYKYFLKRDLGPYVDRRHPRSEWAFLIATKLAYLLVMVVLPLAVLDLAWWQFVIGFVTMHLTAGLILGIVFQLAHVVETTVHLPQSGAETIKRCWMEFQMRTTNNFARGNRLLSWYIGGLNYQIEHHLFPRICHVHYEKISPIVEAVARKHGVPYNCCDSLTAAVGSHYRMLRQLGASDSAAAESPHRPAVALSQP